MTSTEPQAERAPPEAAPVTLPAPGPTVDETLARATPRVWVTSAIFILLMLTFIAAALAGVHPLAPTVAQLLDAGASFGPSLLEGEWWRLLSAGLLHAGVPHLLFNLWALWDGGQLAERIYGNAGFAALYLLSGVGAVLLSVLVEPLAVGVGASGAIFGVYGALLTFSLTHRGVVPKEALEKQRGSLLAFLGYNVLYGLIQRDIDLAGHAGGLLTGAAAGWLLRRDLLRPAEGARRRWLGAAGLALFLAMGAVGTEARVARTPEVRAEVFERQTYAAFEVRAYERAVELANRELETLQEPRARARVLRWRARAHALLAQGERAAADLRAALRLHDEPEAQAHLCQLSHWYAEDAEARKAALLECDRAMVKDATSAGARMARGELHLELEELEGALGDAQQLLLRDPGGQEGLDLRSRALIAQGRLDEAEQDCAALDRRAGAPTNACARLAWKRNDPEVAAARLKAIQAARPDDVEALIVQARLQQDAGALDEALVTLDRAIRLEPFQAGAVDARVWLHVLRREFAAARADADLGLKFGWLTARDRANLLGSRCFALAGLGDRAAARRDCAAALELAPGHLLDRGMLAFLAGRGAEAAQLWEQAVKERRATRRELEPWIARAQGR